jgi:hypothetical protein
VETDGTNLGLGANLAFQFGVPEGSPRVSTPKPAPLFLENRKRTGKKIKTICAISSKLFFL